MLFNCQRTLTTTGISISTTASFVTIPQSNMKTKKQKKSLILPTKQRTRVFLCSPYFSLLRVVDYLLSIFTDIRF